MECYISLERSRPGLINGNILKNAEWNYYHQKPETNIKHGIIQWKKFLIIITYYIPLKRSWKVLFNGNPLENADWNYYHRNVNGQKPVEYKINWNNFNQIKMDSDNKE